jgi:16S rRNA (guanine527-N7)-methyltransferase
MTKPIQDTWHVQLASGLQQLSLNLTMQQQAALIGYLALLKQWNVAFNLTAVREPQQMVSRQLLDSLAILPWVTGARVLDVGTGAGLPGIPLAIALPDQQFVLLDSKGKKTRFIQHVIAKLALPNVTVEQVRVEAYRPAVGFDTITARAFCQVDELIRLTVPVRADQGQWALMLGRLETVNLQSLQVLGVQHQVVQLQVPDEKAQRHLLQAW